MNFPVFDTRPRKRLVVAGLAIALLCGAIAGGWHISLRTRAGSPRTLPPAKALRVPDVPPLLLRDLDRETAIEINGKMAFSKEPNPPAVPFVAKGDDLAQVRALNCLTSAIYFEAANETPDGQRAVAQAVLNRVRHPAFPKSVCAVTYQGSRRRTGCQFSFTCDGALLRTPFDAPWAQARAIAAAALDGAVFAPVGYATHYHANYVVPYWAPSLEKNAVVGTHIFYRWPGWWGQPAAFRGKYSGQEPDPRILRHLALGLSGKPQLDDPLVDVDPRVELLSIIDLLAAPKRDQKNEEDDSEYQKKVREHFSDYSNHVAVEIYRQLRASERGFQFETALSAIMQYSAVPGLEEQGAVSPAIVKAAGGREALDGFFESLRDFVEHTHFEDFFAEQRTFYAERNKASRKLAIDLLANVERNTANRIGNVTFIQSSSLHEIVSSGCMPLAPETRKKRWLVIPASVAKNPSPELSALADTLISLSKSTCKSSRVERSG